MRVTLFIPCFVDMFYPRVDVSIVQILERLGHHIDYPEELTCCDQPAFNCGYWDETRPIAERVLNREGRRGGGNRVRLTRIDDQEILPRALRENAARPIRTGNWRRDAMSSSDSLVTKLGVTELGARFPHRVTFHDGCHGLRELGNKKQPHALLAKCRGLNLSRWAKRRHAVALEEPLPPSFR